MELTQNVDLIVLTSYFNPAHYKSKSINYRAFRNHIKRQNVKLLTIECAFGDEGFELTDDDADIMIRVRSNSKIWQKERLLNIAIKKIPSEYTKFCIADCDIIFQNDNWASETSVLLDTYCVVQPFEYCCYLDENGNINNEHIGFEKENNELGKVNDVYNGRTGFCWAGRKDVINSLYDKAIVGGGDSILAYSIHNIDCWTRNVAPQHLKEDIDKWKEDICNKVQGSTYFTEGKIHHMWHGSTENRKYEDRQYVLRDANFNPNTDLTLNKDGCWEIDNRLKNVIFAYFQGREEDG
jgi:hypothetical protein